MKKSIQAQIATILVEINSRLSNLKEGEYQLSIKSGRGKVYLNRLEYQTRHEGPTGNQLKSFPNYDTLFIYLTAFNDGLEFSGLELYQPEDKSQPEEPAQDETEYITFRQLVERYPSLKDKDYKEVLFSEVVNDFNYQVKPEPDGTIDCGDMEYSDYKGYLNVILFEVTE